VNWLVPLVDERESKLCDRVDAAVADDGDSHHTSVEQITRCLEGFRSSFCNHFHDAFRLTRLALNNECHLLGTFAKRVLSFLQLISHALLHASGTTFERFRGSSASSKKFRLG